MGRYFDLGRFSAKNTEAAQDPDARSYIVLRTQHGEGCDYTIGCGRTWEFIKLNPEKESLNDRIYEDLVKDYGGEIRRAHDSLTEDRAQDYEIYEIKGTDFSWSMVLKKLGMAAEHEDEIEQNRLDKEEFERLKRKLGK